jgi:hypothetical protein
MSVCLCCEGPHGLKQCDQLLNRPS